MSKSKSRRIGLAGLALASILAVSACSHVPIIGSSPDPTRQSTGENPNKKSDESQPKVPIPASFRPINNDCSGGYVSLTFDDGPNAYTDELLDRLKALHLNATFFVLGQNVWGREDLLRREMAEGHRIENHSWDHTDMVTGKTPAGKQVSPWGVEQVWDQIRETQATITEVTGVAPTVVRPPFGSFNYQVVATIKDEGLFVDDPNRPGSITSEDYNGLDSDQITERVLDGFDHGKRMVVQHDGLHAETFQTIGAMQGIVDGMNKRKLCSTTDFNTKNGFVTTQ